MAIPEIAIQISKDLEATLSQLRLAKQLKTEAETIESNAKTKLLTLLSVGPNTYESTQGYGTASYVPADENKKFDKQKAAQGFLAKGVGADVIKAVYEAATETKPREAYVKYVAPKE